MAGSVTKLRTLATALGKAEVRAKDLRRQRDAMIAELFEAGYTTDDIADYAGMSQPRASQIVKQHRERERQP